jgi:hypothetical protein
MASAESTDWHAIRVRWWHGIGSLVASQAAIRVSQVEDNHVGR